MHRLMIVLALAFVGAMRLNATPMREEVRQKIEIEMENGFDLNSTTEGSQLSPIEPDQDQQSSDDRRTRLRAKRDQISYWITFCQHDPGLPVCSDPKFLHARRWHRQLRGITRADSNSPEANAARGLIDRWNYDDLRRNLGAGTLVNFPRNDQQVQENARRFNYRQYLESGRIDAQTNVLAPNPSQGIHWPYINLQVQLGQQTYANVLAPVGTHVGTSQFRSAFYQSLQSGQPVIIRPDSPGRGQTWIQVLGSVALAALFTFSSG